MSDVFNKLKNKLSQATSNLISSDELKSSRLEICINCEHLIKVTRQCSKCYCVVDAKVLVKKATCPKGKW
jgi:hypothetical protein